jgi:hypothetical protein
VSIVLKSGNLNLLEPSGPVKACNGIALPFYIAKCSITLFFGSAELDHGILNVTLIEVVLQGCVVAQASACKGFDPTPVHIGYVTDKVRQRQVSVRVPQR